MFRDELVENQDDSFSISQYYQDIIDCMPNIVYVLDKNCFLQGCNKNLLNLLNIDHVDKLKGRLYKNLFDRVHWSKERVDLFKHDDIAALLADEPAYNIDEAPVIDADGEIIYYQSTRVPLFDKEKNIIGLVVILTDITDNKNTHAKLDMLKESVKEGMLSQQGSVNSTFREPEVPPKVLLVEDNILAQKASKALLLQLDCEVDIADTSEKVISIFKPGKYDIIFMDIGLLDTSGYIVSKKIRQIEKDTPYHVPIIALTGYEADIVKYDCTDYNMEGAITKPLTIEQAKQIIQHYIYNIDVPVRGLKSSKSTVEPISK